MQVQNPDTQCHNLLGHDSAHILLLGMAKLQNRKQWPMAHSSPKKGTVTPGTDFWLA